jgi:hypothetical protein
MVALAASGCSTGSNSSTGGAGSSGTPGAGGSTGAAGNSTGAAGNSAGAAGNSAAGSNGAAGTSAAAGATGAAGSSSGPSVCDGTGTHVLTSADGKVDNFEGAMLSTGWSTFNDFNDPTTATHTGKDNSVLMVQAAGGALNTGHYGHYMGMGARTTAMGGFGVGAIYNEAIDVTNGIYCVDISAFDGVTFWAKAATAGSKIDVNFVVPETNAVATNPALGGGDCTKNCYNHPRKTITLTADWAQYSVAFADAAGGSAKVTTRLQQLGWLTPDSNWDFSLDEIQLYKGTPPTGPVAP